MIRVGFIVEGDSERIVYESEDFQEILKRLNLTNAGVITPQSRTKFFNPDQLRMYYQNILKRSPDKVFVIIDKETDSECLSEIKKNISCIDQSNQINIIQVKTLESWFLADSEALSLAFHRRYRYENPEKTENHPFEELQKEFKINTNRGLGSKESTLPAKKMVNKYKFSIENAANHPKCPSAKYFLDKLSELSPNL
jgi:uncharacterized protein YfkK (UPF0435 family)